MLVQYRVMKRKLGHLLNHIHVCVIGSQTEDISELVVPVAQEIILMCRQMTLLHTASISHLHH